MGNCDRIRRNRLVGFLIAVCISNLEAVSGQSYKTYTNQTISEVCPYSTFCHEGPLLQLRDPNKTPCCVPCSCEADCYTRGNCCPDFKPSERSKQPTVKCKPAVFANITNVSHVLPIIIHYYIIDTCPSTGHYEMETAEKCINPRAGGFADVEDVTIVSKGERVYANRYCAICNQVTEFDMWTPILYAYIPHPSDNDLLPLGYILEFVPLNAEQAKTSECFLPSKINGRCSGSENRNVNGVDLIKACEASPSLYFSNMHMGRRNIFKNPFCFLCNQKEGASLKHKCLVRDVFNDLGEKGTLDQNLMMVLDTKKRNVATHARDLACPKSQIYDPYFAVCRRLFCPPFSVAAFGQCVTMYSRIEGFTLTGIFELISVDDIEINGMPNDDIEEMYGKLQKAIGLGDRGCGACAAVVVFKLHSSHAGMYTKVTHRLEAECSVHTVLDRYKEIWESPIHLTIRMQKSKVKLVSRLIFNSTSIESFFMGFDPLNIRHVLVNQKHKECPQVYEIRDRFCPYIQISRSDFMHFEQRLNPLVRLEAFRPLTTAGNGVTNYSICLNDYLQKRDSTNSAGAPTVRLTVIVCTFILAFRY